MKHQALFSSKVKSEKIKLSSAAILLGAVRVNMVTAISCHNALRFQGLGYSVWVCWGRGCRSLFL